MNRWEQVAEWLDNPQFGVEVGSKHGRFSSYLLKRFPDLTMVMIDPMEIQPEGAETYGLWNWEKIEQELKANMTPFKGRYIHIRGYSENEAKHFEDGYFDFAFIDAQHDYISVKRDIELWTPKVNGLMAGHDYCEKFPDVMRAVDESFKVKMGDNDTWARI